MVLSLLLYTWEASGTVVHDFRILQSRSLAPPGDPNRPCGVGKIRVCKQHQTYIRQVWTAKLGLVAISRNDRPFMVLSPPRLVFARLHGWKRNDIPIKMTAACAFSPSLSSLLPVFRYFCYISVSSSACTPLFLCMLSETASAMKIRPFHPSFLRQDGPVDGRLLVESVTIPSGRYPRS